MCPAPSEPPPAPCQLRDHHAGILRLHARLLPRGGNALLAGEQGQGGMAGHVGCNASSHADAKGL